MKRLFWATAGMGFGAVAAVGAMRWAERTRAALTPTSVADRLAGGAAVLGERLGVALAAGRDAAAERERELRTTFGDGEGR